MSSQLGASVSDVFYLAGQFSEDSILGAVASAKEVEVHRVRRVDGWDDISVDDLRSEKYEVFVAIQRLPLVEDAGRYLFPISLETFPGNVDSEKALASICRTLGTVGLMDAGEVDPFLYACVGPDADGTFRKLGIVASVNSDVELAIEVHDLPSQLNNLPKTADLPPDGPGNRSLDL